MCQTCVGVKTYYTLRVCLFKKVSVDQFAKIISRLGLKKWYRWLCVCLSKYNIQSNVNWYCTRQRYISARLPAQSESTGYFYCLFNQRNRDRCQDDGWRKKCTNYKRKQHQVQKLGPSKINQISTKRVLCNFKFKNLKSSCIIILARDLPLLLN